MVTQQPLRVKLHAGQKRFRDSKALYRGFVGGRGSGKSYVGALDLLLRAASGSGHRFMAVAPTYIMLRDSFAAGGEVVRNFKQEGRRWGWTEREFHDDHVSYFFSWYNPGEVEYEVQATLPGKYHILPAEIGPMYSPDIRGHSDEFVLNVIQS